MSLDIELLEQSFAAVAPKGDELVDAFYRNLFADYPSVLPLFEGIEIADQKKKLLAALKTVVANLRKPEVLEPTLLDMGARHIGYGAQEAHYPAVGATLLKSLAEVAGDLWNDELQDAWSVAYDAIQAKMLEGPRRLSNRRSAAPRAAIRYAAGDGSLAAH